MSGLIAQKGIALSRAGTAWLHELYTATGRRRRGAAARAAGARAVSGTNAAGVQSTVFHDEEILYSPRDTPETKHAGVAIARPDHAGLARVVVAAADGWHPGALHRDAFIYQLMHLPPISLAATQLRRSSGQVAAR